MNEIKQVGNLIKNNKYDNPSRGRIYSIDGIAPTLVCPSGGHSVPYIEVDDNDEN